MKTYLAEPQTIPLQQVEIGGYFRLPPDGKAICQRTNSAFTFGKRTDKIVTVDVTSGEIVEFPFLKEVIPVAIASPKAIVFKDKI